MLGRGTRKGERIPDKSRFVVFDCFDGTLLEYFRGLTSMTVEPPEGDGKTITQIVDEIWINQDREYNVRRLVKRLRRIDKQMSGDAREAFARFIPGGDVGVFAEGLPGMLRSIFAETMKILRDPGFQDLLVSYPRPPRTFLVAIETEDDVTSEWLIKGATGQEFKPADYLKAFERFVRDNADQVEAISILLSRPHAWGTHALRELRQALAQAPEHFTEANLQKAFEVTHEKALVDIISMVKKVAVEGSRLMTADERVQEAVQQVVARRELTVEQAKWIDYIRQHLVANLSIDADDFDSVPVLANRGGLGRARKVFEGKLEELLKEFNSEVAA